MNIINKENVNELLKKYRNFHDCAFRNINYDTYNQKIEIIIALYWELNESETYERIEKDLKIVFNNIVECNIKEINFGDIISKGYMDYVKIADSEEGLCFSSDESDPLFCVICKSAQFEEVDR